MTDRTYTLKEVAAALSRSGAPGDVDRIARQVRHWTQCDLLQPVGKKYTGTGVSRRYTADEVRKAAILAELSHFRVPVTILDAPFAHSDEVFLGEEWEIAIAGKRPVYLEMAWTEDGTSRWRMAVDWPRLLFINPPVARETKEEGRDDVTVMDPERPTSMILINLTETFARLRL